MMTFEQETPRPRGSRAERRTESKRKPASKRKRHVDIYTTTKATTTTPQMAYLLALLVGICPILFLGLTAQLDTSGTQAQAQPAPLMYFEPPGSLLPGAVVAANILPPPQLRPNVRVNLRDFTRRVSDEIHAVFNKTNCQERIRRFYADESEVSAMDVGKIRDHIISQINSLFQQHKAAVSNIVNEAEQLVVAHIYNKHLRVNYTDVHRLRNELEPPDASSSWNDNWGTSSAASGTSPMGSSGGGTGSGSGAQFTSINGGTPVPGPSEWQTPIRSIVMVQNKNFGEIPVNTSMSAVHLPLPIYAGLHDIMNGIAWTERLDMVFRRNFATYSHVHHQVYGDHLGFMRTFPAHKWRIPRSDPDLFDARIRPWYVAGASMPKDVVILVDTSGSMTGLRREIAKGVVFEILDTLTSHDHFAVLRFSEGVTPIGFPKCNLRTPKMGPALEEQCRDPADQREAYECSLYKQNWDRRGQYLRDHPNLVLGKNGSYLSDELYKKSVVNITSEIRDSYLLPATSRNIRYLKSNFSMPTAGIANFTNALMAGFELLNAYNRTIDLGSHCNQAIMLITDGAIRSHDDIFHRFNYPNSPVRVFTYMIGREVGDITHTKAMACNNRGYYTHVINLGEVREQVQKYLPVMARPLVLRQHHPITWTHVYGDETYQVLTDWVLELKRRERARIILNEEKERQGESVNSTDFIVIEMTGITEYDELPQADEELKSRNICEDTFEDDPQAWEQSIKLELDPFGHHDLACHWTNRRADLLISVVMPVFDTRNTSLIFERVLHKNIWTEQENHVRNAQLLGVAAVDLRVADLLHAAPSHLLGPNGYAVIVGQNGFVLHHPDFRALLEDPFDKHSKILKPHFGSVDLTHIIQLFHRNESVVELTKRRMDDKVTKLREATLKRQSGFETFYVKRAVDCRRRLQIKQQTFYYGPIKDTPLSFMLALPQNYGLNRLTAKRELNKESRSFFILSDHELWTVHPDYRYCEGSALNKTNSDSAIIDVLDRAKAGLAGQIEYDDLSTLISDSRRKKQVCDRELFPSLLFDAEATFDGLSNFYGSSSASDTCGGQGDESRAKMAGDHGLELSFVATRSGLTKVRVFDLTPRIKKLADVFIARHSKAVDESWYSRTVDWNMRFQESATIITAPYNAYIRLIVKLRQRITQRHPAANDTRANCDPRVVEDDPNATSNSSTTGSETNSTTQQATSSSPESMESTLSAMQDDDPSSTGDSLKEKPSDFADGEFDAMLLKDQDFSKYSTYDFLDLIANSSVHISATQSVIVSKSARQRQAVAVTGLLYDYATFARRFLNATSLDIQVMDSRANADQGNNEAPQYDPSTGQPLSPVKIDICPNGDCPTKCGLRNDTIDCLLIDNNGFIVVGEELPHIGRSLVEYDEKLMQSLVERQVFHRVTMIDYQAICSKTPAEVGAPSGPSSSMASVANSMAQSAAAQSSNPAASIMHEPFNFGFAKTMVSNLGTIGTYLWTSLFTMMFYQSAMSDLHQIEMKFNNFLGDLGVVQNFDLDNDHQRYPSIEEHVHWSRSPISLADAQTASSNQSLLALLPNKTYLRPCEKIITLYETRPIEPMKLSNNAPEYYVTKCNCSGWYVYEAVPNTNLVMLIVNITSACRRCPETSGTASNFVPVVLPTPEPVVNPNPQNGQLLNQPYVSPNKTNEDAVCSMLEREAQLYVKRPDNCVSYHPDEAQIHICGAAFRSVVPLGKWLLLTLLSLLALLLYIIV